MRLSRPILFSFFVFAGCAKIAANPQDPHVMNGQAQFDVNGNQLSVQATDKAIINWGSFSISKNEATSFQLPSSQACILNRVVGGNPSEIYGQLNSNGTVYLINPQGIIVGSEGLIQTNAFLGSSLNIADADFLKGKNFEFTDCKSQKVSNEGRIVAKNGDVILLGPEVKNSGLIEAPMGKIAIGAGREIRILPRGDERIQILVQPKNVSPQNIGIEQTGKLKSLQTELKADGNLYSYAIKNDGYISATRFENRGGQIVLMAEKGHVNHSGSIKGEDVKILGEYVTLIEKATVDVSQASGGGSILVGGDCHGANPHVMKAKGTLIEQDVCLFADALVSGDGGKVIVWADDITGFYGQIFARGGSSKGNGGFVEVSGSDLDYRGLVNTLACHGQTGTLLIDPTDITISAAPTDAGITFGGACGPNTFCNTSALSPRNINNAQIVAQLALSNVIVDSRPGGPAGANGDISFTSPFLWTGPNTNTFTLNARRNINFNANFTNSTTAGNFVANAGLTVLGVTTIAAGVTVSHSSAGTITFNSNTVAGSDVVINGNLSVTGGNLTMLVNDDITTAAGSSVSFNSPGNTFSLTTTAAAGSVVTFGGPVAINGIVNWNTSGTLNINSTFVTSGTGAVTMNSVGTITTGAGSNISHGSTGNFLMASTTADIVINGGFNATSANVTFSPFDDFTLAATGSLTYSAAGKTLTFTAGPSTSLNFNGFVNVTGGNVMATAFDDITIAATTGSFTYNVPGGSLTFNSAGGLDPDFNLNGTLTVRNGTLLMTTFDDIIVAATGTFNFFSPNTATLNANGPDGDITMNGVMNVTNGSISLLATDDITFGAGGVLNYSSPGSILFQTTGGTSTNDITMNGNSTYTNGMVTMDASGSVTFGTATNALTYTSPLPFTVTAHLGNITFTKFLNLTTSAPFTARALVGNVIVNNLVRNFSNGPMTVTAGLDFTIGNDVATIPAAIGSAGGLTTVSAGGNFSIISSETTPGATAFLGFSSGGQQGSIIATVGGDLMINANQNNNAGISSPGALTVNVTGDISLFTDQIAGVTGNAIMESHGEMLITMENMVTSGLISGASALIQTTAGNMLLIAQNSIAPLVNAFIRNLGPGNLTLVVDQQAPFPPEIGPGRFDLFVGSEVSTNGGILRIFTARPSQNAIFGLINGHTLAEEEQVFGVWFSTFTGFGSTVYYKAGGPAQPLVTTVNAASEVIQTYFDRMMGWAWMSSFWFGTPECSNLYSIFYHKPFQYFIFLPFDYRCFVPPVPFFETF